MFTKLALFLIRVYQSVPRPPVCRFRPTCSEYSYEVIRKYGIVKGLGMAVKRISHCHPF